MSKLQKKISEIESYLEEKDRVILEQEQQLSQLQDEIHAYIKGEETWKEEVNGWKRRVE